MRKTRPIERGKALKICALYKKEKQNNGITNLADEAVTIVTKLLLGYIVKVLRHNGGVLSFLFWGFVRWSIVHYVKVAFSLCSF